MPTTIAHLIFKVIDKDHSWKITLFQQWPSCMGNISHHAHIYQINDDSLVISVSSSAWLQELYLLSGTIITKVNQIIDHPRIKQVRFIRLATILPEYKNPKNISAKSTSYTTPQLTCYEKQALEKVTDEALQEVLTKFLARCQKENI